jgi:hypothetical protein
VKCGLEEQDEDDVEVEGCVMGIRTFDVDIGEDFGADEGSWIEEGTCVRKGEEENSRTTVVFHILQRGAKVHIYAQGRGRSQVYRNNTREVSLIDHYPRLAGSYLSYPQSVGLDPL